MPLSFHAILWDLDGVLADTADLHYHAWAATLAEFGLPYSRAIFDAHFGMNNVNTLIQLTPEALSQVTG